MDSNLDFIAAVAALGRIRPISHTVAHERLNRLLTFSKVAKLEVDSKFPSRSIPLNIIFGDKRKLDQAVMQAFTRVYPFVSDIDEGTEEEEEDDEEYDPRLYICSAGMGLGYEDLANAIEDPTALGESYHLSLFWISLCFEDEDLDWNDVYRVLNWPIEDNLDRSRKSLDIFYEKLRDIGLEHFIRAFQMSVFDTGQYVCDFDDNIVAEGGYSDFPPSLNEAPYILQSLYESKPWRDDYDKGAKQIANVPGLMTVIKELWDESTENT